MERKRFHIRAAIANKGRAAMLLAAFLSAAGLSIMRNAP
jgi:hypothetical protein